MIKKSRAYLHRSSLALIVVATVMSAGLLSGCGEDSAYAVSPAKLTVNGVDMNVPFIATINGKEVSLDEYRYYFLNMKYTMDGGDPSYWEQDADGSRLRGLKAQSLQAMKETYAVEVLAKKWNLTLTSDELSQIDEDVKNQIAALGGSEKYLQALSVNYLTDNLYRFLWKTNFYCEKLWIHYFNPGGLYYDKNADGSITEDELDEKYTIKFKAIIAEACDNLSVKLAPEYDLITIESLT